MQGDGRYGDHDDEQGVIYLLLNDRGETIYIGQTTGWVTRRFHHMGKRWWHEVATVYFLPCPSRAARYHAERGLVETLVPKYNVTHTGEHAAQKLRRARRRERVQSDRWIPILVDPKGCRETRRAMRRYAEEQQKLRRTANVAAYWRGEGPAEVGYPFKMRRPKVAA